LRRCQVSIEWWRRVLRTGFPEDFVRRAILGSSGQERREEKERCVNREIDQSDLLATARPEAAAFNVQSACEN
jgi:hypothetical protein